jgi:uncharacterized membrane protein YgdD (TMEM256/DUF423 family)
MTTTAIHANAGAATPRLTSRRARASKQSAASDAKESYMSRASFPLSVVASLLGAAGVVLAALSTHADGGELGRTAAEFLILHAATLLGVCAQARTSDSRTSRALIFTGGAMALGVVLFSGDLTARAFAGNRLFPFAAPTGGTLMIVSWIALAVVFAVGAMREDS